MMILLTMKWLELFFMQTHGMLQNDIKLIKLDTKINPNHCFAIQQVLAPFVSFFTSIFEANKKKNQKKKNQFKSGKWTPPQIQSQIYWCIKRGLNYDNNNEYVESPLASPTISQLRGKIGRNDYINIKNR